MRRLQTARSPQVEPLVRAGRVRARRSCSSRSGRSRSIGTSTTRRSRRLVGGPDAAIAILTTIAASMVSLAALVLTITMVVVQLAMGQFSPRIVQRILRDKPSQFAIGLFVATFVHAILAVREVTNNGDGTGQVPGSRSSTAFVLVLASIAVLVIYVHHIGQALRVSALIELVGNGDTQAPRPHVPGRGPRPAGAGRRHRSCAPGVRGDHEDRLGRARRRGSPSRTAVLELVPALGEFVPPARRSSGCTASRSAWTRTSCTRR